MQSIAPSINSGTPVTTTTTTIRVLTQVVWPGLGLLGESYILFSIGTLSPLWEYILIQTEHQPDGDTTGNDELLLLLNELPYFTCAAIMMGMLVLGFFTSRYGRRVGSITTSLFMLSGCCLMTLMIVLQGRWRRRWWHGFGVGMLSFAFGVGGEYPVAAASATERSITATHTLQQSAHKSGRHIQFIFAMQGVGILLQVILLTLLLCIFQQHVRHAEAAAIDNDDINNSDASALLLVKGYTLIWLILFCIGTLILLVVFVTRLLLLQESSIWKQQQQQQQSGAHHNHSTVANVNHSSTGVLASPSSPLSVAVVNVTNKTTGKGQHCTVSTSKESRISNENETRHSPPQITRIDNDDGRKPHHNDIHWTVLVKILLFQSQYGVRLVSVSLTWFLWDVAFYGNKLFQSTFLNALRNANNEGNDVDSSSKYSVQAMIQLSVAATINASIALCGYYVAAYIIDHPWFGRRKLQLYGFILTGLLFVGVGLLYNTISTKILIIMYFGTSFFGQCGPNATTFILPSEIFPTQVRTICHGVAAASGKFGALIATIVFHRISNEIDLFLLSGYMSFVAAIITYWFVPETLGHDLRENDQHWEHIVTSYLDNSSDGTVGDDYLHQNPLYLSVYEQRRQLGKLNNFHDSDYRYTKYDDAPNRSLH